MDNILLIHLGRHKTGTTALQSFLSANRDKLAQYGWCYPDFQKEIPELRAWPPWKTEKNGTAFFTTKETKYGESILYERDKLTVHTDEWNKIWDWLLQSLKSKNVIISEEALWYSSEEFLAEAKKRYENIKVIVYIRRQDRAMEYWWNQMIKGGRWCDKSFHDYLASDGNNEIREGLHYLKKLDQISGQIGKKNCIVRVYEKQQLQGEYGIISDFFSALGFTPEWNSCTKCLNLNDRLFGNYIEIKRVINSVCSAGYLPSKDMVSALERLSQRLCEKETGYFTVEERKKFMGQFASENEQIAKEYLHRENGVLFYDNRMNYPIDDIHQCSLFEKNLIQVFSAMLCTQHEEILHLKNQSYALIWKLILQKVNGRKLLLFGAGEKCRELMEHITIPVEYVVDNDLSKAGNWRGGAKIVHTKEIHDWSQYLVVITCIKTDGIEEQLQSLGLKKEEDYVAAKEYFV